MQDKLSIPDNIKVGFQERRDTYTGRLAYVISMGRKGKKRKTDPKSWVNWRDKKIEPEEYENEPTEGFVLNKDVGGTQRCYSWNARREKVRVYDPRGFEFEITVENVLLILQECSSIKGKGLEGEFVYAWSGSQIVLLPVGCPEYNTAMEFIELGDQKVTKADMVEGCTYLAKDKENLLYLGRHPWFDKVSTYSSYYYSGKLTGQKKHVFLRIDRADESEKERSYYYNSSDRGKYRLEAGFTKLAKRTSDSPVPQYADAYEKLMKSPYVTTAIKLFVKNIKLTFKDRYGWYDGENVCIPDGDRYYYGTVSEHYDGSRWSYRSNKKPENERRFDIKCDSALMIDNGELKAVTKGGSYEKKKLTKEEVQALAKALYVKCENGAEYKLTR